ncbi:hypothetical protein GDO78_015671 [Eleutherodactylus coqui]|uniref:Uncharacterized protein n=1 Tax=Eleutherodactylus coqui TaxID=57060 RepID=A0A8J6E8H8_ELECQ|nr:hypothetical protein GDO78_015671 [Eleutherodactylus coqui]
MLGERKLVNGHTNQTFMCPIRRHGSHMRRDYHAIIAPNPSLLIAVSTFFSSPLVLCNGREWDGGGAKSWHQITAYISQL